MPARDARHYWLEFLLPPLVTLLSVAVAALGVYFSVKSNNDTERKREQSAAVLAQQDSERSFQLAAVQIVMSQRTCKLAQARAKTLIRLFPEQLGAVLGPLTQPLLSANLCKQLKLTPTSYGAFVTPKDFGSLFTPQDLRDLGFSVPKKKRSG
jgi:hypothetical protein